MARLLASHVLIVALGRHGCPAGKPGSVAARAFVRCVQQTLAEVIS
jgi:hypothetical protein